jgi:TFIIF-interacting CTD phosphatase-like protein
LGGYTPLPVVEAPYLVKLEDSISSAYKEFQTNGRPVYTLVLDLDETLVHYYEIGEKGDFNIRPGVSKFLKEMAELYEVVIFTAAMQDVSNFKFNF